VKQLGIPVSALNMTAKNRHVTEENANQCGHSQMKKFQAQQDIILFFKVNTLLHLHKNLHSVRQITLTCIMILYTFSFWQLYAIRMFIHCLVIYLHYLLSFTIKNDDVVVMGCDTMQTHR
jgi:hypothetical protein